MNRQAAIEQVFKSSIFSAMCKRFGGQNHEDLKSEVMLIILELPKDKINHIIENGYLQPYTLNVIRNQTNHKQWSKFRKLYDNRENLSFTDDLPESKEFNDPIDEQHNESIRFASETIEERILNKIKSDSLSQSNTYFYHSRLILLLNENFKSIREMSREVGIPLRSMCRAIREYKEYLKQWAESAH